MFRNVSKQHRNTVTRVTIARAGNDDAGALDFLDRQGRFERNGDLLPNRHRFIRMKLKSVAVDSHRADGERQIAGSWLRTKREPINAIDFFCAHT